MHRSRRGLAPFVIAGLMALTLVVPVSAAEPTVSEIASRLDSPRGLTVGSDGAIYVAEAGHGGTRFCYEAPSPSGEIAEFCVGSTGHITRIADGRARRVLRDLPSTSVGGAEPIGPSDVSILPSGDLVATVGLGGNPVLRDGFPRVGRAFGWLVAGAPNTKPKLVADISAFELSNPDAGQPGSSVDSNPNSVVATPEGSVVVDAGGNDLLWVAPDGTVSLLAVFPSTLIDAPPFLGLPPGTQIPLQAVPTSVAIGPDGAYYVGTLTGFPFPAGGATVFRVEPGSAPEPYATGFTNIMDVAFDADGNLLVLEIAHNGLASGDPTGALLRVPAGGGADELLLTDPLFLPGGVAVGPDGAVYVTNCSVCVRGGSVLRIDL